MKVGRESASEFLISIVLTPITCGFTALNSSRICYSIDRAITSYIIWGARLCFMPRGSTVELLGCSTEPLCPWRRGLKFLPPFTSSSGVERVQRRKNRTFDWLLLSHLFPTHCELLSSILPNSPWHVQDAVFVKCVKHRPRRRNTDPKSCTWRKSKKNC